MIFFNDNEKSNPEWIENNKFEEQVSDDDLIERVVLKGWDSIQTEDDDLRVCVAEMKPDTVVLAESFLDGEEHKRYETDIPEKHYKRYRSIYDRIIAFSDESYDNTFNNGIYAATLRDEKKCRNFQLRLMFSSDGKSITILRVEKNTKRKIKVLDEDYTPLGNEDVFELLKAYASKGYKILDVIEVPQDLMTDYFCYEPFTVKKLINSCKNAVANAGMTAYLSDKKINDFVNGEVYKLFLKPNMLFYISMYSNENVYLLESEYMEIYKRFKDELKEIYYSCKGA